MVVVAMLVPVIDNVPGPRVVVPACVIVTVIVPGPVTEVLNDGNAIVPVVVPVITPVDRGVELPVDGV